MDFSNEELWLQEMEDEAEMNRLAEEDDQNQQNKINQKKETQNEN